MKTIFIGIKDPTLALNLAARSKALGVQVIGRSGLEGEIVNTVRRTVPDFVILEEQPTVLSGLDLIHHLKNENTTTRFICFLQQRDTRLIRKAFHANVSSILFAEDGITELAECFSILGILNEVHYRKSQQCFGELKSDSTQDLLNTLTPCQLRILSMITRPMTMPEIAQELFISRHTVNNHIANIRKRLRLKGRGVILKYALANKHRLSEIEQLMNTNRMAFNI
ncbi:MAG: LuxR C-terminal-related transcriptional regulator [Bacteroidota bacterium]